MNSADKLEEMFRKFPGIGGRQAKRFVYFLLKEKNGFTKELAELLIALKKDSAQCAECFRFFQNDAGKKICPACEKPAGTEGALLLVEKDMDFETVHKSGTYEGRYFILGGVLAILEKDPTEKIRIKELIERIERDGNVGTLKEIILAFSLTAEGDNTAQYVRKTLEPLSTKYGFKISTLGRGFSTGLELEYTDSDTLGNALKNRF